MNELRQFFRFLFTEETTKLVFDLFLTPNLKLYPQITTQKQRA